MRFREEHRYRSIAVLMMFIATLIVLQVHKWSIDKIHERLKAVESKLNEKNPIDQEIMQSNLSSQSSYRKLFVLAEH